MGAGGNKKVCCEAATAPKILGSEKRQHPIIGETNVFQKKTQSFSSGGLMYSLYVMCQLYRKELS